jgi:hypothetical protein
VALTLARTLRLLAAEKKAVLKRQSALVASLNRLLPSIGYRVVLLGGEGKPVTAPLLRPRRRTASAGAAAPGGKPLSCPYCSRVFALPLHLGRHVSVTHKPKKTPAVPAAEGGERPAKTATKPPRSAKRRSVRKAAARGRPKRSTKKAKRAAAPRRKAKG